jgi:hypothetical protein
MENAERKLIADALYEIGLLLRAYLGSENSAPNDVRMAAHLAYALHNEASALATGTGFDISAALKKVAAIDAILDGDDGRRLAQSWAV